MDGKPPRFAYTLGTPLPVKNISASSVPLQDTTTEVKRENTMIQTNEGLVSETKVSERTVDEVTNQPMLRETILREKVAGPDTVKLCFKNVSSGRIDDSVLPVEEVLLSRQFIILGVYVDSTSTPFLIKVEDFLGNLSFILFDRSGTICVKRDIVKQIRRIEKDVSSSFVPGLAKATLTDGVVLERGSTITIGLKGCRPTTDVQVWEFTDATMSEGIYPLTSLNNIYKSGSDSVGIINESVKYLDTVALTRAVEGVTIFSRSLDSLLSFKKLCKLVTENGNLLVNSDKVTDQLVRLRVVSSDEFPERITVMSSLVNQKRIQRRLFNQLILLSEEIIKVNSQLCEVGGSLLEIHRILEFQAKGLRK